MRQKHIVLAEDETPARTTLTIVLGKAGYKVTAVTDGTEALDFLVSTVQNQETVDLLVTDLRMPGLTGMELIDELKKNNIDIPVLVITGFGSKEMVIQLIRKGCSDFIEKPFEPGEVLKRVEEVLKKMELEQVKRKTSQETLEMENYKQNYLDLTRQFDSAVDAYRDIIEIDVTNSHVKVAYRFKPLSRLGGDFFDVRNTSNGCNILVADVAGHDMGASLHAVLLKAFFNENVNPDRQKSISGQDFFRLLNNQLIKNKKVERMVTALFLDIDLDQRVLETVCAGHPPVLKPEKHQHTTILPGSPGKGSNVLGIFEDAEYDSQRFPIKSKDRFVLYTDGVIDAFRVNGPSGEKTKLTMNGLIQIINRHKQKELNDMIDAVWDNVFEFCRGKPHDDMLLLGVEVP